MGTSRTRGVCVFYFIFEFNIHCVFSDGRRCPAVSSLRQAKMTASVTFPIQKNDVLRKFSPIFLYSVYSFLLSLKMTHSILQHMAGSF
jgi:hypothetical protein